MLLKKNRLSKNEVDLLFKEGKAVFSAFFTFKFLKTNKAFPPRISVIAPKSVAKLAVKRNFLRRKGYQAVRKTMEKIHPKLPLGLLGAFIFKKLETDNSTIENEIQKLLNKIN